MTGFATGSFYFLCSPFMNISNLSLRKIPIKNLSISSFYYFLKCEHADTNVPKVKKFEFTGIVLKYTYAIFTLQGIQI